MVERHTISVSDFLVNEGDLTLLEVGRWLDDMDIIMTALDLFELGATELGDSFLNDVFLFYWSPEETNIS